MLYITVFIISSSLFISLSHALVTTNAAITNTAGDKPYLVNLKFSIKPSRRQDFLTLIKDNQRKTLELEPASLQYTVGEDIKAPNTFYIHEQFIGSEGFEAHRAMAHAGDWAAFKNSKPFVDGGEPILDFYFGNHKIEKVPVRSAFGVHVEILIKPEVRAEFLEVIHNNQKGSLEKEPLCLQYVFGESASEENKFIFHEEYTGKDGGLEGFEAHKLTPHFKAWEDFVAKNPFTKPPVVDLFRTIN